MRFATYCSCEREEAEVKGGRGSCKKRAPAMFFLLFFFRSSRPAGRPGIAVQMLLRRLFPCVWGSERNVPKPSVAVKFMTSNSCFPSKTSMRGSVLQWLCSHSEYCVLNPPPTRPEKSLGDFAVVRKETYAVTQEFVSMLERITMCEVCVCVSFSQDNKSKMKTSDSNCRHECLQSLISVSLFAKY